MKNFFIIAFLLLAARSVEAQTPSLGWNQSEAQAVAQTYTYTLKIDNSAPTTLTATCVASGVSSTCSAPFVAATAGVPHTYTLTATNSFGSTAATIGPGMPPGTSTVKVTITITLP